MEGLKKIQLKERKLLFAFAILILLTFLTGLVGMSQVRGLNRRIVSLGRHNLRMESAVLEMRINNKVYAIGIRNYVFWRASRYLGAVSMAIKPEKVIEAGENFKKQLEFYRQSAYLPLQKEWADEVGVSFDELFMLGKKIIASSDNDAPGNLSENTNNLLMSFENRIYKIDEFLDNSMGKANLAEIERQLAVANADKDKAIIFLKITLFGALILGILIAFSVYRRRIKERNYRQQIFNRMVNLEENERKKLSTAVHDEMGQDLSAVKIYLGIISQQLGEANDEIKNKVEECKKIASRLIEKSHNIAFLLRPPDLDEVGLTESLESLILESRHLTGAVFEFNKLPEGLSLAPEYNLLIYRVIQELLTNMAKHASAKNVKITLSKNDFGVELFYQDDGLGFEFSPVNQKTFRRKEDKFRLGLLGLKERIEVLDGQMRVNSAPGKGTVIIVKLPV
ncbi:MAG: histidine kinase [Candidatus Omnitrophica bacterium]|jgi:signal transduction histidine kinase|nr:histidine kinase [Candidatus Omnitrophota bacterium]